MREQQIFMSVKENTNYAYAVGRIRALEARLLDRTTISRLLDTENAAEALKMLSEGDYESSLSNITDPADFETALNIERERIYAFIDQLSLDQPLTNLFRARWDFHNLKALLKASYTEKGSSVADGVTVDSGLIPVAILRSIVEPEDDQTSSGFSLPGTVPGGSNGHAYDYIMKALADARIEYEESRNPQVIDVVIDNHAQNFLYQQAVEYQNPFLVGYFESIADLTNIKSFIRMKMLGEGLRVLDKVLLPGGSLDKKIYVTQFDETVENFAAGLTMTPYGELVAEGIRRWAEEKSLAAYERLSDNYLINYIRPAKYIFFGVEPLIGYLLAKEHEMKLIRIIVIGKLNDLPTESIKERLRDTYV